MNLTEDDDIYFVPTTMVVRLHISYTFYTDAVFGTFLSVRKLPIKRDGSGIEFSGKITSGGLYETHVIYRDTDCCDGMEASDLKCMKELEAENSKLKQRYAGLALENRPMKDLIEKSSEPVGEAGGGGGDEDRAWITGSVRAWLCGIIDLGLVPGASGLARAGCGSHCCIKCIGGGPSALVVLEVRGPLCGAGISLEPQTPLPGVPRPEAQSAAPDQALASFPRGDSTHRTGAPQPGVVG